MNDNVNLPNFYEILGLKSDCSKNDIKKKYRELAKKTHPDKGGKSELFEIIVSAYETLIDTEERKKYDELCKIHNQEANNHYELKNQSKTFYENLQFSKDCFTELNIHDCIEQIKDNPCENIEKSETNIKILREQEDIENLQNNPFANGQFDITQFNIYFNDSKIKKNNQIIKHQENPMPWNYDEIMCKTLDVENIPCQLLSDEQYIININDTNNINTDLKIQSTNIELLLNNYKKQTEELTKLAPSEFINKFV